MLYFFFYKVLLSIIFLECHNLRRTYERFHRIFLPKPLHFLGAVSTVKRGEPASGRPLMSRPKIMPRKVFRKTCGETQITSRSKRMESRESASAKSRLITKMEINRMLVFRKRCPDIRCLDSRLFAPCSARLPCADYLLPPRG